MGGGGLVCVLGTWGEAREKQAPLSKQQILTFVRSSLPTPLLPHGPCVRLAASFKHQLN